MGVINFILYIKYIKNFVIKTREIKTHCYNNNILCLFNTNKNEKLFSKKRIKIKMHPKMKSKVQTVN